MACSRKNITSCGFLPVLRPDTPTPVVVMNRLPNPRQDWQKASDSVGKPCTYWSTINGSISACRFGNHKLRVLPEDLDQRNQGYGSSVPPGVPFHRFLESSCGFWQKRVQFSDLLEGGLTALQEPTLTILLALPRLL